MTELNYRGQRSKVKEWTSTLGRRSTSSIIKAAVLRRIMSAEVQFRVVVRLKKRYKSVCAFIRKDWSWKQFSFNNGIQQINGISWSMIWTYTHLYSAPPLEVTRCNFAEIFGNRKIDLGLSSGVICVILSLAILVQCQLVTDGQTHRLTDTRRRHMPR